MEVTKLVWALFQRGMASYLCICILKSYKVLQGFLIIFIVKKNLIKFVKLGNMITFFGNFVMHGQTPKLLTPAPTPTPSQSVDSDSGSDSSCQK